MMSEYLEKVSMFLSLIMYGQKNVGENTLFFRIVMKMLLYFKISLYILY